MTGGEGRRQLMIACSTPSHTASGEKLDELRPGNETNTDRV